MNKSTVRQRRLYLSAKLYELAAEFTDTELAAMLSQQILEGGRHKPSSQVIRALLQLHHNEVDQNPSHPTNLDVRSDRKRQASSQASSLVALFNDTSAFPSVASIAEITGFSSRIKESRERYTTRLINHVDALAKQDRLEFLEAINKRLQRQPDSFISKWSKVIKDA